MPEQDVASTNKKTVKAKAEPEVKPRKEPEAQESVWVLADDRPGNVSQALGIAQALRIPYAVKKITYDAMVRLPNIIRGSSLLGLKPEAKHEIIAPWPTLVISAGRRTAPVARYIKKQSGGTTRIVHMMWPSRPIEDIDMLILPEHDKPLEAPNIFRTIGAPNGITSDRLERERFRWEREFAYLPRPLVAVLVGGGSKHAPFTVEDAKQLAQKLNLLLEDGGALLMTTSRRSSKDVLHTLKSNLKPHFYLYDWASQGENPYLGFLAHAEAIVVTGDSVGMCSEACSTGKPVYIYNPSDKAPAKMQLLQEKLYEHGCARPLKGSLAHWRYTPLDEAKRVAEEIRTKFL